MRNEYDFSNAEIAKFYTKPENIQIPIYLEKSINDFYLKAAHTKNTDLSTIINAVLKKEIEIHHEITNER